MSIHLEKWQRDLAVYKDINTTFIIEGNVHDRQPWVFPEENYCEPVCLSLFMYRFLQNQGYDMIVFYNPVDGFYNPYDGTMLSDFFKLVKRKEGEEVSVSDAISSARICLGNTMRCAAVIFEMANTLAISPEHLSQQEESNFSKLMLISKSPMQAISTKDGQPRTNLLFLVTDKINDIPAWFYVNNPYVKTLTITDPEKEIRQSVIGSRLDFIPGAEGLSPEEREEIVENFALITDGMALVELEGVFTLCRAQNIDVHHIKDAVFMYQYGQTESQWDKLGVEKITKAEQILSQRVKGQETAVRKVTDILSRAALGLTGLQGGSSSRPKGVLFFAGPTGTGKTELAKSVAEFLFGDDSFLTRFDMSEYGQPHSDQKLLGAPPGYVGYSAGGQLTNAIKEKPFCVLLFDEIEKAHPTILDKFLQILEDGRLTDSSGKTVYFTESLIIFTSNLGMNQQDEFGHNTPNVTVDMDYEEMQTKILGTVKDYFKYNINRPELLNRIGDNFVVFDFIRPESCAKILMQKIEKIQERLYKEKAIRLTLTQEMVDGLYGLCLNNLENGGRGIGNVIESYLVNPISNILATEKCTKNADLTLSHVQSNLSGLPTYQLTAY